MDNIRIKKTWTGFFQEARRKNVIYIQNQHIIVKKVGVKR